MVSIPGFADDDRRRVDETLASLLPQGKGPEKSVYEAMHYACFNGGKRLRPGIVLASARLFGVAGSAALRVAAAVEMVHCYSLIHDDLPALDNDDVRRGRPTCHIAFDEATAILAGDGLQVLAFEVLADPATDDDPARRVALVSALAGAAGACGMIAGQAIDLALEHVEADRHVIERLQALKTGALFTFSAEAGAILGGADTETMQSIIAYGRNLGATFQIVDDILDHEGDGATLGKAAGKDATVGKATLIAALGVEQARTIASELARRAIESLEVFGDAADDLRNMARFVVQRRH